MKLTPLQIRYLIGVVLVAGIVGELTQYLLAYLRY